MRGRPTSIVTVSAIALACLLAGACASRTADEQPPEPRHPILLIGMDGLEWNVALPLLESGELPHLAALMGRGVFGELDSSVPTDSPIIWTSMATGLSRERHGILGFLNKAEDPEGGLLYNNRDRRTKAFWNIASENGLRVGVVGWWMTFPVEAVEGVMVAQANTSSRDEIVHGDKIWKGALYEDLPGQVYPPERQEEILSVVAEVEAELPEVTRRIFGDLPEPLDPVPDRLWEKCLWAVRADEIYRRVGLQLLRKDRFDIFTIYFGGPDVLGHRFWRYLEPDAFDDRPDEDEIRLFGHLLPDYYRAMDSVVGQLVAAAPADSNVLVVSDHGMHAFNARGRFTEDKQTRELKSGGHPRAPAGVFVAAGPDVRAAGRSASPLNRADLGRVGSVMDLAPTLLALSGLPVGRDMDGTVMREVIAPAFLERHPVREVDTHTPPDWFASRPKGPVPRTDEQERLEQLRALGYIGGGRDDGGDGGDGGDD